MSDAIKCAQCSHDNDVTRVFCQNCGLRLERPVGSDPVIAGNTPVMGRYVVKKNRFSFGNLVGEGLPGGAIFRFLRGVVTTAILGALLAVTIQMARRPDGIPAQSPANEAQANKLFLAIKSFSDTIYPRTLDMSQDQMNNYLAVHVVSDDSAQSGSFIHAQFVRAFVVLRTEEVQFTVEQKFGGWPVFMYLNAVPEAGTDEVSGAKTTTLRVTGGGVGRVRLHARLLPILEKNLASVVASTSEATSILRTASSVSVAPGMAKLSWQGTKPPGR